MKRRRIVEDELPLILVGLRLGIPTLCELDTPEGIEEQLQTAVAGATSNSAIAIIPDSLGLTTDKEGASVILSDGATAHAVVFEAPGFLRTINNDAIGYVSWSDRGPRVEGVVDYGVLRRTSDCNLPVNTVGLDDKSALEFHGKLVRWFNDWTLQGKEIHFNIGQILLVESGIAFVKGEDVTREGELDHAEMEAWKVNNYGAMVSAGGRKAWVGFDDVTRQFVVFPKVLIMKRTRRRVGAGDEE